MKPRLYFKLWHYAHALETRFFLLNELRRLRTAGKRLPKWIISRILDAPSNAEDWIHLACFLDPKEKHLLIDVGANIGDFTQDFLETFPDTIVKAYEPVHQVFETMDARYKGDARVTANNCALSNFDGTRTIHIAEKGVFSSFERYTAKASRTEAALHTVPQETHCCRLDSFSFEFDDRIVVLKVDVQGHEIEVLEGGKNTLQNVDVCLIETSFANQYENRRPSFPEVTTLLEEADLFLIIFQEYGRSIATYAYERDVVFVKRKLLDEIWFETRKM